MRLLALKVPPSDLAPIAQGRRLYPPGPPAVRNLPRGRISPTPELLQKLGIPAGRVQVLYREKQPLQPGQEKKKGEPEICPDCNGLGYKGRIAIYEILVLDDKLQQALVKRPEARSHSRNSPAPPATAPSRKKAFCWWPWERRRSPNCNALSNNRSVSGQ